MDWETYRARCDEGDVLSRWLLEQTAALLHEEGEASLAAPLEAALGSAPVPRPADHRGGSATDFFPVPLAADEAMRIRDLVQALARQPQRRLPGGRGFGGVGEAWAECAAWLDGSHPRSPHRRRGGTEGGNDADEERRRGQ